MKVESSLKHLKRQNSLDYLNMAEPEYPDQTLLTHWLLSFWELHKGGWDEMDNPQGEIASYFSFRKKKDRQSSCMTL